MLKCYDEHQTPDAGRTERSEDPNNDVDAINSKRGNQLLFSKSGFTGHNGRGVCGQNYSFPRFQWKWTL